MAAPQIGVLLPVRLETRFNRSGRPARWSIRVRVIPDAMSIANHDDLPSAFELDAVEAMWRAAGGANLESPDGQRAWRTLAASVGPERGAWLARTFPPAVASDGTITITRPAQTRTDMRAPLVLGLPPILEIWIARGGQPPARSPARPVARRDAADLAGNELEPPAVESAAERYRDPGQRPPQFSSQTG